MTETRAKRKRVYGFAHIGNPIEFKCPLPFKLSPDLSICRPTVTQLKRIRKHLHNLNRFNDFRTPYESVFTRRPEKSALYKLETGETQEIQFVYVEVKPLPKQKWKYAIVKYRSDGLVREHYKPQEIVDLEIASRIGPHHLNIFNTYGAWSPARFGSDTELFDFLSHGVHQDYNDVWTLSDLEALKKTYNDVVAVRMGYPELYHACKLYWSLPNLRGYNELLCLGLFAVIESLITHNPKGESDSISHQIAAKVKLLSNRFERGVEHDFGSIEDGKLWKKLYDFRSKLAHGGKVDFRGTFQILTDAYTVQLFLEEFLRALLRFALVEPRLCMDLKEC